jgi:hypothetical protein
MTDSNAPASAKLEALIAGLQSRLNLLPERVWP